MVAPATPNELGLSDGVIGAKLAPSPASHEKPNPEWPPGLPAGTTLPGFTDCGRRATMLE